MAFLRAALADALWSGEKLGVTLGGRRVLLVRCDGDVYAYEDRCAHLGLPLSGGRLEGEVLTCAAHEWQYDVRTGRGINPKQAKLRSFAVEVRDGAIWVDVG
jgi:toluene monooxygenase system ferredoxin subunit